MDIRIPAYQTGEVIMKCDECGNEWELYKSTYCPNCGSNISHILKEEPAVS